MGEVAAFQGDGHGGAGDHAVLARSKLDLNDIGNARRLAAVAGGMLLFIGELGRAGEWVHFNGQRWSIRDGAARALACAQAVVEEILHESKILRTADGADVAGVYGPKFTADMAAERAGALYAWAMKSGNSDRISGMLRQAAAITTDSAVGGDDGFLMRAGLDDFDTDPLAYNCTNGVLRFIDCGPDGWIHEFTPGHRPADRMMQIAAVAYDPAATCPQWRARLVELHDDPVARTAIQRIYGMTVTGLISDQAFYIFQGKGGDGKSMSNQIIGALHGDYFRSASPKTFLASKQERSGSEHQADIVRLKGDVRLVVIDEPKKGSMWDGERIKQATGSRITARAPNALEDITFVPRWQLIAECNTLPRAPSDDRGFRRRFKQVIWAKSYGVTAGMVEESARIVEARLMAEISGIFLWMVDGALEWLNSGEVPEPALSAIATSSFWASGSAMSEWIDERCDLSDPAADTRATALYEDFVKWSKARGDKEDMIPKQTSFGNAMNEKQIYAVKDAFGLKVRRGIKLKPDTAWDAGGAWDD